MAVSSPLQAGKFQVLTSAIALGWHNRPARLVSGVGSESRPDMLNLSLSGSPSRPKIAADRAKILRCSSLPRHFDVLILWVEHRSSAALGASYGALLERS